MILERIVLTDFRCFYGEREINFAVGPKQNVTLIHAENGVGKTTLLNALLWCFYKKTTRRFEKKDDIVNHQAAKEGKKIASVEVFFEQNGEHFVAKRHFNIANPATQNTLKIATEEFGNQVPHTHSAPETFINSVIPMDMAGHFLFDGEHAEAISGEENRKSVGAAVRDILGTKLAENAIEDVAKAHKEYVKLAANSTGDSEVSGLTSQLEGFDTQVTTAHETIDELEEESSSISKQMADINEQLRNTAAVKETQRQKELLEHALDRETKRAGRARRDVLNWLGDNGHFLVAKKITEETFSCLDDETTKGKIPAPYNKDFVSSLLAADTCVCGRPLHKGSKEAEKVAELLNTASTKILQDRIIKVRSRLESLRENRKKAPQKLVDAHNECSQFDEEIAKLEAQLQESRDKIKDVKFGEIAQKEEKLSELRDRTRKVDQSIGVLKQNIVRTERAKVEIEKKIESIVSKNSVAKRFIVRRDLATAVKERLETRLAEEDKSARKVIQGFISGIIEKTSRKSFRVLMDKNFTVTLRNSDDIEMPKSEGENQLLGLAFTAALCKFAKLRKGASGEFLLPGTEAPLVLDSPFGKLDTQYKIATAEFIPEMAGQVVLMVSKEQGSENVLSKLRKYIGAEYCLISHNSEERGDKSLEYIEIGENRLETTIFDADFDGTEIREVQ